MNATQIYAGSIAPATDAISSPMSAQLQDNLGMAVNIREIVLHLRGRMFGYPPPTAVDPKASNEPHCAEDVARLTANVMAETNSILTEINLRF